MYTAFFGFSQKPFDVTPDPQFLYLSPSHRETLASLIYGIRERRGFITVIGEVGTGKTTLLHALLGRLNGATWAAFVFNTTITFDEMLTMVLLDLKLVKPGETLTQVERLRRLNESARQRLFRGGNVVIVVDEAQNLGRDEMENLRLLSNLETPKHKLIQIVLSGQPELDAKLSQPELRQLAQRIALKRYILPLKKTETFEYVQHRLQIANYNGPPLFNDQTREMIWMYSGGVPRKINVLCDNALLIAYALRRKTIGADVAVEAIRDLCWSPFVNAKEPHPQDLRSLHPPLAGHDFPVSSGNGSNPAAPGPQEASLGTQVEIAPDGDGPTLLLPRIPAGASPRNGISGPRTVLESTQERLGGNGSKPRAGSGEKSRLPTGPSPRDRGSGAGTVLRPSPVRPVSRPLLKPWWWKWWNAVSRVMSKEVRISSRAPSRAKKNGKNLRGP
jgi:type II secretory pathway predicted ATPase ExeA